MKYTILILCGAFLMSCSQPEPSAEDVLRSDDWWEPVHVDAFAYGNAMGYALTLFNSNGEVVHLSTHTPFKLDGQKVRIFLELNYENLGQVEVVPGSELEQYLLTILNGLESSNYQKIFRPSVEGFKSAISDRRNFIY